MPRDDRKHRSRRDSFHSKRWQESSDDDEEKRHRHRKDSDKDSEEEDDSGGRHNHHAAKRRRKRNRRDGRDRDSFDEERKRRKNKKHRQDDCSSEEEDRRRRKHHERKKEKKRSSRGDEKRKHKTGKKDKKEKKKGIKRPDKSKMQPLGPALGRKPDNLIDPSQDYYSYHEHFWVYLYREEGIAFNDMTSEETRESFDRFAKAYNSGSLELEYYGDKLPLAVSEESKTTKHAWSFKNVLTDREKKGLQTVQEGIRKQTEYNSKASKIHPSAGISEFCKPATFLSSNTKTVEAPTFARKTPGDIQEERRANKRLRDQVRNVEEELQGGPKDFRERRLEKKRQQVDRIHGASRNRDDAGIELSDSALYGGDGNTNRFESAVAREKARKAKRTDQRSIRIQELEEKEKLRHENMLELLGLKNIKPGQKIAIAPRRDE